MAQHLNTLKFGSTHKKVWWLSALGIMLDGFDFFILGVALPLIVVQWNISPLETGLVSSAAVVGAIVGASLMGRLADKIGRSLAFKIDLAMFVVFALASAFAPDIWWLIAFRFLLGVGVGADYPIASTYVAEISPTRSRSRLLIGAFSFQAVGQLLGALVGLVVLSAHPDPNAWRWMLAFGVIPAVIIVLMRRNVPESPMWLASMRRYDEAVDALQKFTGRRLTVDEVREVTAEEAVAGMTSPGSAGTTTVVEKKEIFSKDVRGATILTSVPWFFMDIATYGIGVFTPTILAALALGNAANSNYIADDITSTEGAAFLDIFLIVGFAAAILLVRKLGLIFMQTVGFVVMGVGLIVLGATDFMSDANPWTLVILFTAFAAFNLFMNAGPNSTTFALPAVAFRTENRGAGAGFAAAAGKFGAAFGTFFFPIMQDDWGLFPTLMVIAAGCFAAALITFVFRRHATRALGEDATTAKIVTIDPAAVLADHAASSVTRQTPSPLPPSADI
ncbi:MFS transporter [Microbacterium sediminicola]|uniref:MFS transporter n=2 Tax=Microbacterium sediminicola TaxID=415210 RepID=A0ABN2I9F2_9MICO